MKPFNLEEAKAGNPVCIRDGRKARIICFDRKSKDYPIVALVENQDAEMLQIYTIDGKYNKFDQEKSYPLDLVMATAIHTGWINVYRTGSRTYLGQSVYENKEEAFENRNRDVYIDTIKIEWEE